MGSNEPSLVPEWLRSNGHGNNGASASNHFASVNSHSDAQLLANCGRNRSSRTNTETGSPHLILERSSSISSRRIFNNNGSSKNPYSSFSRSHRDREPQKVKLGHGDIRERDNSEPMVEPLRRTRSMVSRNQGDSLPRRVASPRNGLVTGDKSVGSMPKVLLEKDFPSLGADEKKSPKVARVGSPSLPIGSSALIREGWSALAEVPIVTGSNNGAQSIHQPLSTSVTSNTVSGGANAVSTALSPVFGTSNAFSGSHKTSGALGPSALNMAEALVQSPPNTPQLSVETQRLEHMTIKKVRQLIPMTPATPKVMSSSDKLKQKLIARAGEISGANKAGQKMSSSSVNAVGQSPRSRPDTYDASKQSHGSKLFVLKPTWENNASATSEDVSNHENGVGIGQTINLHAAPLVSSGPVKSTPISKGSTMERKSTISSLTLASAVEKRPLSSSAQSRSDFFNSVRKKTLMTTTVSSNSIQSPSEQKSCELLKVITPSSPHGTENGNSVNMEDVQKSLLKEEKRVDEKDDILDAKEAAFLRSLGWEENDEEGGLTEKEINDFYQMVEKLKVSLPLSPGVQSAFSMLTEHHASNVGEAAARLNTPDAAL